MNRSQRLCRLSLSCVAVMLATATVAQADPYFQIGSMSEWDEALMTGHVVPFTAPEWDRYMGEWDAFTEEGETYPDTVFIEPMLYVYEGDEVAPYPESPGGLVMAWGDEGLQDGSYAAAWKYDYLVDPDLSNAIITLTVYPPQFGPNGGITQISFGIQDLALNTRSWYWNVGPGGSIPWNVPTVVTIDTSQIGLNATFPPADGFMNNGAFDITMVQYFIADENGQLVGGQVPVPPPGGPPAAVWNYWYDIIVGPAPDERGCCLPDGTCAMIPPADCFAQGGFLAAGGMCQGDANGNGVDDACEQPSDEYLFEFSLDIGSDTELSDPFRDGDEGFDPGDVYWWQSAPVTPPGRDGFKDDLFIFGNDPWPNPPDATGSTAAPVGTGTIQDYWEWFDLDGHDQLDVDLREEEFLPPGAPAQHLIPKFDSQCIYEAVFLMLTWDDDMGRGYVAGDVPVTAPSPAGVVSYGMSGPRDEIVGLNIMSTGGFPPFPFTIYPIADEVTVHSSMAPNPDNGDRDDDDVDSLDIVPGEETCPYWYFSPDHEAHLGLDPGGIYLVTATGPVQVIDEAMHLGIPEDADVDAFEFVWAQHPDEPGPFYLALAFSVDDDDSLTAVDESGGLDPTVVWISFLTGYSMPLTEPTGDDIDGLTAWHSPLEEEPPLEACCLPDGSCVDVPNADCLAMGGFPQGAGTDCSLVECFVDVIGAASCNDHVLTVSNPQAEWCLPLVPGSVPHDNIEPRLAGVTNVQVFVSNVPPIPVNASVSCDAHAYAGTATVVQVAPTELRIKFNSADYGPALPDQDCCRIDLTGGVLGMVPVRSLKSDIDANGSVLAGDMLAIKIGVGRTLDPWLARFDLDGSGSILASDMLAVKTYVGNVAPACP